MKNITETQPATPFGKFKQLTERLLAVPKKEIDQKQKEYERKKKYKKRNRKKK
jgi:hypothetical protein